jgi:hypothetical protein
VPVPHDIRGTSQNTVPYWAYALAQMNDNGSSFAEIADYIEANL